MLSSQLSLSLQEVTLTKIISPLLGNPHPKTSRCDSKKTQQTLFQEEQLWRAILASKLLVGLAKVAITTGSWFNSLCLILGPSPLPDVVPKAFPNKFLHTYLRIFETLFWGTEPMTMINPELSSSYCLRFLLLLYNMHSIFPISSDGAINLLQGADITLWNS